MTPNDQNGHLVSLLIKTLYHLRSVLCEIERLRLILQNQLQGAGRTCHIHQPRLHGCSRWIHVGSDILDHQFVQIPETSSTTTLPRAPQTEVQSLFRCNLILRLLTPKRTMSTHTPNLQMLTEPTPSHSLQGRGESER